MSISANTKINLIIGDPIFHSLSPFLHNFFYRKTRLSANFVFLASNIKEKGLEQSIFGIRALGINGLSCTIPHKTQIIQFLDQLDNKAKIIGAVNTVINQNSKLVGYNTDWLGVLIPLLVEKIPDFKLSLNYYDFTKNLPVFLWSQKSAVIGSGGAARAAVFALLSAGSEVWIFNRTIEKAEKIKKDFEIHFKQKIKVFGLNEIAKIKDCQIIFNSTDVGMNDKKDFSPVPKKYLNPNQILFDAVYKPKKTKFLKFGQEIGSKIIYGYQMLLWQAVFQFQIHTNKSLSLEIIQKMQKILTKKS
jgi:shikimate dehydrogenase